MSPALAAKFPGIRSFRGQGIDDPTASVRLDLSPSGLHAQIVSASGTIIIDPFGAENQYASFNKRANRATSRPFECLVQGRQNALAVAAAERAPRSGQHLRTYRLAVACTGEYAARFGGTTAGALAAINTTVNRVTGIYEREASIRLMLVDNNDEIIFTNAQADPFDNHNPNVLIDQSQSIIDSVIGNANYDIGHTMCTGDGGLAGLGVVCRAGQKARGITGRPDPFGDPFDVDYVAHEMGHQFDGDHTFNGSFGSCGGGNRNGSTAFEPGSGSTIQGYAGICGADNLQANSDPYFHSISLDQIIAYTTTGGGNVPTPVPSGNGIPVVDGGPDITVPVKTPFKLKATGSDPDSDILLYCWEERDLGPVAALGQRDDGRIPLFRSFSPATGPSENPDEVVTLRVTDNPFPIDVPFTVPFDENAAGTVSITTVGPMLEGTRITLNAEVFANDTNPLYQEGQFMHRVDLEFINDTAGPSILDVNVVSQSPGAIDVAVRGLDVGTMFSAANLEFSVDDGPVQIFPIPFGDPETFAENPVFAGRLSNQPGGSMVTGRVVLFDAVGNTSSRPFPTFQITAGTAGDFDGDGRLTAADIDALCAAVRSGNNELRFDVNGDGSVNQNDHTAWVKTLRRTWIGDANLDGEFNSGDFVSVFQMGEYEDATAGNSTWSEGDWNCDGDFSSSDFVAAFQDGGYEKGPLNVPEPSILIHWWLGLFLCRLKRRR
jgi:hypothetical protein